MLGLCSTALLSCESAITGTCSSLAKDFNDLDNRQVVEVARVLDRVLSGGQATISGSEHLTPDSARQWIAKKWEFITSKRQGAGAGKGQCSNAGGTRA